ncbi:hypothetical protein AaE_003790 [Aphanomyces astaci]|uniref:Uncharacterized protein n=1 Tax=Aphanomyces astaci TaxID=112090 RepID=A0A6A5AQV1_APHAT|nr:hypothetical protein AaE_003790 [Aphanomyces astaci]
MVIVSKVLRQHYGAKPLPVNPRKLNAQLNAMLRVIGAPGRRWDAGLLLTDDKHIQFMNKKYRHKDKPTDILSFPNYTIQTPGVLPDVRGQDARYLGDMFLSLPYIESYCLHNGIQRIPLSYGLTCL